MTEKQQPKRLLHRWRDIVKSEQGPPDPVLRCVLLVLGAWEKEDGMPFSVPNSILARQTGLKDRAIRYRLQQLDGVWFTRQLKRGGKYTYRLRIPTTIDALPELEAVRGQPNDESSRLPSKLPSELDPSGPDSTVDNSPNPGTPVPGSQNGTPAPPCRNPGTPVPRNPGTPVPTRRKRHKKDVARPRARPVASLARAAPDSAGPEPPEEPPPGDEQLPIARIMLAVQQGNQEEFDRACESLRESERTAAGHA